ncbi:MAG: hypothetical protein ACKOXO_00055 [Cyanobium sp.]
MASNRPPSQPSDQRVRLQIFGAFVLPLLLLGLWLNSRGFFSTP